MERRALRQIFDELGLAMTPSWAFDALEQTRDPVAAFKRFCAWVGVDPLAAQNREHDAMLRLSLAIELLSELAPLRSLLIDEGDRRICDALRDTTGPDPLARLCDQVVAAAELHRIGTRLEKLPRCALALRMQTMIREVAGDPLATARSDIEDGISIAKRLEDALRRLKTLDVEEVARDLELLREAHSRGALSSDHAAWCDEQAEAFELLLDEIETNDSLGVIEVEEHVRQAEAIRDSLLTMRGHSGPGPRPPTPEEEVDEALAALGLARCADWRTIERRANALRREHNTDDPDHRATPEQLRENTKRMQEINNAMDCLKKYKDRLADLMA